ncbi:hypothetical protein DFQ05_1751 [Winogradskyella wandonensis]|uniref:Uncharacterized protein n=1 Tax=Winogradskyella wandonensis TaxID=1442586 RepID=A0A4R1KTV4_9FLAO|nr:hypothetical protein [Winogradskyella wandonensis]TCK67967.1 hypothetical protein DFQ05_1751 [Winogradskyella wandonensis]
MKSTTDNMTCLLLGHNFYKKDHLNKLTDEVICKNCGTQMLIDSNGDIDTSAAKDKNFETTLRKFFLLKRKLV